MPEAPSNAVLYIFNGGAMLTIVGLFIHMVRVTMPAKDVEFKMALAEQNQLNRDSINQLIAAFREDIAGFREEINHERDAHEKEVTKVTTSLDRLADKLERYLERNSRG